MGHSLALAPSKKDYLVGCDPLGLVHFMTLNHLVANAPLHAGDEELVIFVKGPKPGKIYVGPVESL